MTNIQKPTHFTTTVVSNEYTAAETRNTRFRIEGEETVTFQTGQFFNLKVEPKIMRAYSIASSSSHLPEFELCVKVVENGKGSTYIDEMKEGDTVEFMGPFGHFGKKNDEDNILMIATGTGIAPMRAICEEEAEKEFPSQTHLIFGVREEEYASYEQYFINLHNQFENFTFQLYVSRPKETYKTDEIRKEGRVTTWVEEKENAQFEKTQVLICGNPAMVKQVKTILVEEKGVEKENIVVEAY